jgi:hypothetical protein
MFEPYNGRIQKMGFGSRKNITNVKMHPYQFPTMCTFIMTHLLSNPPSNHLMENILKMNVEEWRKSPILMNIWIPILRIFITQAQKIKKNKKRKVLIKI